jgi:hypothetical protein
MMKMMRTTKTTHGIKKMQMIGKIMKIRLKFKMMMKKKMMKKMMMRIILGIRKTKMIGK